MARTPMTPGRSFWRKPPSSWLVVRRPFGAMACFLPVVLAIGCAIPSSPAMATVPLAWRGAHPWGPEANAARMLGQLQPRFYDAQMSCWAAFAREQLHDGDIVFRKGRCYFFDGACSSSLFADISDSPFSHEGIVH